MKRLSSLVFNDEIALKIVRALDINEARANDDMSIWMIKLCGKSIIPAISLIYKNFINSWIFPNIQKKFNVIPVHKKSDKQVAASYRLVRWPRTDIWFLLFILLFIYFLLLFFFNFLTFSFCSFCFCFHFVWILFSSCQFLFLNFSYSFF